MQVDKLSAFDEKSDNHLKEFEDLLQPKIKYGKEKNALCYKCGNHGFKDKECPVCGLKPNNLNLAGRVTAANTLMSTAKKIRVPDQYIGITWHKNSLMDTHSNLADNQLFIQYCTQLELLHQYFVNGKIPTKSGLIIAPPQFSKVTFAYSCMQFAIDNGLKVAPLLDTQEVKRLITLAAEKPGYYYDGLSYEDYIFSDIMFITVTKTRYYEEAYQIIQEMLDKRSRKGLPTFFISRYSLDTLGAMDKTGNYQYIKDWNDCENSLKYPVIVEFRQRK